jgi:hypothetical protein
MVVWSCIDGPPLWKMVPAPPALQYDTKTML